MSHFFPAEPIAAADVLDSAGAAWVKRNVGMHTTIGARFAWDECSRRARVNDQCVLLGWSTDVCDNEVPLRTCTDQALVKVAMRVKIPAQAPTKYM